MVVIKCNDCGGNLTKDSGIYICEVCGKVFNKSEAEKDNLIEAFEITEFSMPNMIQMLSNLNLSGFFGCAKTNLAEGDVIELENGEKIIIQGFYKLPKMKKAKAIEAGSDAMVIINGKKEDMLPAGTMVYKNIK